MSFAAYAVEAFAYECEPDPSIVQLTAVATVAVVTFVNCWFVQNLKYKIYHETTGYSVNVTFKDIIFLCRSVQLATQVQNVFCSCKLVAVAIIIGGGFYKLCEGHTEHVNPATTFVGTTNSLGNIATAFYSGLWAYDGWNNLNYVTEEIINPEVDQIFFEWKLYYIQRNLPLSIGIAIPLVTIIYVLVNISYLTIMSPSEMLVR